MSKLQAKTIKILEENGCYVINVTAAAKNGVPDIVGCFSDGRFFAVECKEPGEVVSELQTYNLLKVAEHRGFVAIVRSAEDVYLELSPYWS